jgi:four helix bundle protein
MTGPNSSFNVRHRSFYFSKALVAFVQTNRCDKYCYSLFDQVVRSGTSIGANVVEGKAGMSKPDWLRFLHIALKSANETKYWLCLIRDTQPVEVEKVKLLIIEADELSKIIAAIIIKSAKNSCKQYG